MAELAMYEVEHRNFTTTMQLSEEDAAAYGDRARKVGAVAQTDPEPVAAPSWAAEVDELGAVVENDDDDVPEKRAAPARNKARHTK